MVCVLYENTTHTEAEDVCVCFVAACLAPECMLVSLMNTAQSVCRDVTQRASLSSCWLIVSALMPPPHVSPSDACR